MNRSPVKWLELFKYEFEERISKMPLVYLPMGLCEPHGHISVFGLDLIKAEYLCEQAAIRFGGIVAPSQGYQIHETGYHAPWLEEVLGDNNPHMTAVPPKALLYFFLYQLRTFHNAGFENAIVITGHSGGNQFDLRMVAEHFRRISDLGVYVFSDPELTNGKYEGDHAGKYEISQLLYIYPQGIDMSRIGAWSSGTSKDRFAQGEDANQATAEYGKVIIDDCMEGIRQVVESKILNRTSGRVSEMISFEATEELWANINATSANWLTHNLRPGQATTSDNSIWKKGERFE